MPTTRQPTTRQIVWLLVASAAAFRPAAPGFDDPLGLRGWRPAAPAAAPGARTPPLLRPAGAGTVAALLPLLGRAGGAPSAAAASPLDSLEFDQLKALDPAAFQPVCPASDGFYRFGQTLVVSVVGPESYKEYAPLIAGGLLRVRLELCVVESFFYEAIIPFIKENGLSWVLPFHETVETFLAGTVFAVATNFILIGSTKIVTVLAT